MGVWTRCGVIAAGFAGLSCRAEKLHERVVRAFLGKNARENDGCQRLPGKTPPRSARDCFRVRFCHRGIELPGNSIPQRKHYSHAQRETAAQVLRDWDEPQRRQLFVLARTYRTGTDDWCEDGLRISTRPNCTGRPRGTRLASRLPSTSTRGGRHASPPRMLNPPPAICTGRHGSSQL